MSAPDRCKSFMLKTIIIGVIVAMITTNANSSFKLMPADQYFKNPKTVALLATAMAGDLQKATSLVSAGANPNDEGPAENPYTRLRPLHYAIAANNGKAVEVLIKVGADPELSAQGFGRSFLFAMTLKKMAMLSLLIELRPISTLSDDTVEYLLFESVTQGCTQCLELFLGGGALIDFPDTSGYTMLMRAMNAQDYDLAEWLLERGASVHIEAGSGATPANSVQFHLNKYIPGSHIYNKVLHLKKMMEERGAVFPAPSPAEVRAKRQKR